MSRLRLTNAALAWLVVRGTLSLAAIVAAAIAAGPLAAAGLALLLALLRPLRRGWLAPIPVLLVAPLSLPAAALLALRALSSEAFLLAFGSAGAEGGAAAGLRGRRRRGLQAVRQQRQAALEATELPVSSSLTEAEGKVAAARRGSGSLEDTTMELFATTLAEARPLTALRSIPSVAVALFSGIFEEEQEGGAGLQLTLGKGLIIEELGLPLAKALVLLCAALVAALTFPASAVSLGPMTLPGWLVQGLAVLLLGRGLTSRSLLGLILGGALAIAGEQPLEAALVAVLAALAFVAAKTRLQRFAIGGVLLRRVPKTPYLGPRRLRGHWIAATGAADQRRLPIAIALFEEILASPLCGPELASEAHARLALHLYEADKLARAGEVWAEVPDPRQLPHGALPAAGAVAAGLGDLETAEKLLRRALEVLPRRSPLRRHATLALADVYSRQGRPEEAIEAIAALDGDLWSFGGIVHAAESEIQIAAALARQGNLEAAKQRLADSLQIGSLEVSEAAGIGRDLGDALVRAEGRARLVGAEISLAQNRFQDAETDLENALGRIDQAAEPNLHARARTLLGVAMVLRRGDEVALRALEEAVEALEKRRTQLHRSDQRAGLILAEADVYTWCFKAFERAIDRGHAGAAEAAAWLIESLRKSALAEMLRSEKLDLPERAQGLVEQLNEIERGDDPEPSTHTEFDARREELRRELAEALSNEFAAAYVPTLPSIDELEKAARQCGDVLSFYMPGGDLSGWRIWIRRDGRFELGRIEVEDAAVATLLRQLETGDTAGRLAFHKPLGSAPAAVWARLAEALLPEELSQALGAPRADGWVQPLLIAPDGVLGLIPWSALRVEGAPLGARAAIQIVPALSVIDQDEEAEGGKAVVAHLDPSLDGHADERRLLERHLDLTLSESRSDFLASLAERRHQGAYIAAHGDGVGLDQAIEFEDGRLSAGAALRAPWPSWTLFASCLVGRVPVLTGQEPLGLPISCALAGSRSVLAATVEVESEPLPRFAAPLLAALAAGEHPARSLAAAQRAYLAENPDASVAECLGFVCLTRSPVRWRPGHNPTELGSWEEIVRAANEIAEEDPVQARAIFERGLEVDPEPRLRADYASFLVRWGEDPETAGEVLAATVAEHPDHRDVCAMHAWWLRDHGEDPDATRAAIERLLEIDPDDSWAIPEYAHHLRIHTEELEEAARYYRRALEIEPASALYASTFGLVLERSGDLTAAREMFERALGLEPGRSSTSRYLASLLGKTGDDRERIERLYERSIELAPERAKYAYNSWALTAALDFEDKDAAREILERGRAVAPEEPNLAVNLAWLLFEAGETEDAIRAAREALELSEDPAIAVEGWFYLAVLGEPDGGEARSQVERLLAGGARSPGWDFSGILERARERDGADFGWAEATAAEIAAPEAIASA
ncbi:MAG TPA: CHAT domain-containing protein [Solirubrobacterales bacterium]|nr:CHAT domain-containing protein [Solirubrobacterales bacterium]